MGTLIQRRFRHSRTFGVKSGSLHLRCLLLLAMGTVSGCTGGDRHGEIRDDTGAPIADAQVDWSWSEGALFSESRPPHQGTAISGGDARFSFEHTPMMVFFKATKQGHYPTSSSFDPSKPPSGNFIIELRRIINPQPMVGKKVKLRLPVGASRLEYDFLAGDCLPPLGRGIIGDLEIEWIRPEQVNAEACRRAFESRVVGIGNGVVVEPERSHPPTGISRFRSKYEAPTDGYEPSCDFGNHFRGGMIVAYIKIRMGAPGGPLFGKLLDPISYWADSDADEFEFEYVVNPSGGRGLEMDMKRLTVPARRKLEYAPEEF